MLARKLGGAGAPAYGKWLDVWRATSDTGEKYIVCNGDESEPGTFKDREILLRMPHLVVEGVILAGLMTGRSVPDANVYTPPPDLGLEVLHVEPAFVVLAKPPGLLSEPGRGPAAERALT